MNIVFVPSNSSHLGKSRLLLNKLRQNGCSILLVCVDGITDDLHSTMDQIKNSGFDYKILPAEGYPKNRHWFVKSVMMRKFVNIWTQFVKQLKTDVVIFQEDYDPATFTLLRIAKGLGVTTVLIPDGLLVHENNSRQMSCFEWLKCVIARRIQVALKSGGRIGTAGADLILAMNKSGKDVLIKGSPINSRIEVVGSPEYDDIARQYSNSKNVSQDLLQKKFHLAQNRPVVFLAHQAVNESQLKDLIRRTILATRKCNALLLLKLHPRSNDDPEKWRAWALEEGISTQELVIAKNEVSSLDIVKECSVCMTFFSTVCLEAMIFDKPVILIQFLNLSYKLQYGQLYGAAIEVESPDELEDAIISAVSTEQLRLNLAKNARVLLQDELLGMDGKSVDRMVTLIADLVIQHKQKLKN